MQSKNNSSLAQKNLIFLSIFLLFVTSCKNKNSNLQANTEQELRVAAFEDFYQKFHSDSLFQVAHIIFPLEGLPSGADSTVLTGGTFYYQKADWRMQHSLQEMDKDMDYHRTLSVVSPEFMREVIFKNDSTYAMERKFAYMDSTWILIYYAGMNKLQR